MPTIGSRSRLLRETRTEQSVIRPPVPLEVGSLVEVVSNSGITVYGVVRWLGVPAGKTEEWAGIELVSDENVIELSFLSSLVLYLIPDFMFIVSGL